MDIYIVGDDNPSQKDARQLDNHLQVWMNMNIFEKPHETNNQIY